MLQKLQPQSKISVDGNPYIVQLYPPTFGLTLYAKLVRLFGQPIVKMLGKLDLEKLSAGKAQVEDLDLDSVSDALGSLFSQIKDEDVAPLLKEILSGTFTPDLVCVVDQFDALFMGQYGHIFRLVAKTVGAQYPGFLSGLVKRMSAAKGVQASKPPEAMPA